MKRLLVLLAACAPSTDSIGDTEFSVDAELTPTGEVGPGGHFVHAPGAFMQLYSPAGALVWAQSCDFGCYRAAVDADGNVYLAGPRAQTQVFAKRDAATGAIAWMRELAAANAAVALDAANNVWFFVNSMTALDFGGGPVGGGGRSLGLWGRYAPDGTYLASGTLDFTFENGRILALPAGGLLAKESGTSNLVAFGDDGRTMWRIDRPVYDVAVHADGELTLSERPDHGGAIVRLDAARAERWRRDTRSIVALQALADGGVITAGTDSLAGEQSSDATTFEHLTAAGDRAAREVIAGAVFFYAGPALDGFRFFDVGGGNFVGRRIR
jgi:hypothetical protein